MQFRGSTSVKLEHSDDDENTTDFLFRIKDSLDDFKMYLTNVLSQQLENLQNAKSITYDIESFDQKNLLKYLLSLWKYALVFFLNFFF